MAKQQGKQAFLSYYQQFFSNQELNDLIASWERKHLPILLVNKSFETDLKQLWEEAGLSWNVLDWYPSAVTWPPELMLGEKLPGYEKGWIFPMNQASLLPVQCLDIHPGEIILDACAAPGGKGLAIAQKLEGSTRLVLNDISPKRRIRMEQVMQEMEIEMMAITPYKAELLHEHFPETFDKILLDAPCSSEKHVWNSPKYLAQWSENRVRQLHQRQVNMIRQLGLALKPGGRLVYSTCAITPEENEAVINEVLKTLANDWELANIDYSKFPGEEGVAADWVYDSHKVRRIWPHKEEGLDAMFLAVLEKIPDRKGLEKRKFYLNESGENDI